MIRKSMLWILVVTTLLFAQGQRQFNTWKAYGGGADSSQYSSLSQINKSNVSQLEVAWTLQAGGAVTFNPLVVDGVMYVSRSAPAAPAAAGQGGGGQGGGGGRGGAGSQIVALDAATGKELWAHTNQGGVGARGMNYWESPDRSDRRLIFINGGFIKAINAQNGEAIPSFGENGRVDPSLNSDRMIARPGGNPGRIYRDTIIVSLPASGASYDSTPGDVRAFDVRTGAHKWTFHSVPRPGEFGADTWPAETLPTAGGVHNWSELTVDEQRGIVFVPFGTARYDFYGGNRKGNNLFVPGNASGIFRPSTTTCGITTCPRLRNS
jgi:quinoprotein glucose dehydrogenase